MEYKTILFQRILFIARVFYSIFIFFSNNLNKYVIDVHNPYCLNFSSSNPREEEE